jgi:quercetin dioxygenase-like cupin family protein
VAGWCELRQGEMEDIPLPDASIDVVISNGVINLSPRKSRVFAEIARILRPGGRMCVADLVVDDDLPPEVLSSGAAWAGCIAGALSEPVFTKKLANAGFVDIGLSERTPLSIDDVALYPLFTPEVLSLMRRLLPAAAQQRIAMSLIARAHKPTTSTSPPRPGGTTMHTAVRRLDDVASTAVADGVTVRPLDHLEDMDLKVLDVEVGHATPVHSHPHAHQGVILSGAGALRLEGRRLPLAPGDVFSIAPNQPHGIDSHGPEPLRLVCLDCVVRPVARRSARRVIAPAPQGNPVRCCLVLVGCRDHRQTRSSVGHDQGSGGRARIPPSGGDVSCDAMCRSPHALIPGWSSGPIWVADPDDVRTADSYRRL